MRAGGNSESELLERWQGLPMRGVVAAPLAQADTMHCGRVSFAGTRVPVATLFGFGCVADAEFLGDFLDASPAGRREQAVAALRLASCILSGTLG